MCATNGHSKSIYTLNILFALQNYVQILSWYERAGSEESRGDFLTSMRERVSVSKALLCECSLYVTKPQNAKINTNNPSYIT